MLAEDRTITREKYSEIKLQTNFFKVSPAYLTATPHDAVNGGYVNTNSIATALLAGNGSNTNMYVVRQAAYNSLGSTQYTLSVPTSQGTITIPQLGGNLVINGRDSKIQVTDYAVGSYNLLYSSAEIFTWKTYGDSTVLVLYAGPGETHEAAFTGQSQPSLAEGQGVTIANRNNAWVLNWQSSSSFQLVTFPSGLKVYLLDRNTAYSWWVMDLPAASPTNMYTHPNADSLIIQAGYLVRTATVNGNTVALTGDLNATVPLLIVGGAPSNAEVTWNGNSITTSQDSNGVVSGTLTYTNPNVGALDLSTLSWKYLDSLPEIQSGYSDDAWTSADYTTSNNPRTLTTPTSLYGMDYGYNTGVLVFRGHFTANGRETELDVTSQGGTAYGAAVWLDDTYLGGWPGTPSNWYYNQTLSLPALQNGAQHVITVVCDTMGLDEDGTAGADSNKDPRGIMNYGLTGHDLTDITWKITGNLGGENYLDKTRGPLNEGGTFAERQGYHLYGAPSSSWANGSPLDGIDGPGIAFYGASLTLDIPAGYDVPLSFQFTNTPALGSNYRVQLFANGWQIGKYVNNLGPQTVFPVQPGTLNYSGENWVSLTLWALDNNGAKLGDLKLVPTAQIQSGYGFENVGSVPASVWEQRSGAY